MGQAKALVRVAGRPQVLRLVDALARLRCTSITCALRADLVPEVNALAIEEPGPSFARVPCRTPSSLHTLAAGLASLPEGETLATMADTVMPDADWAAVGAGTRAAFARGADAVLAVTPHVGETGGLYVELDARGRVLALHDTPVAPVRVTGGVYGLGPAARLLAHEAVDAGLDRMRGYLRLLIDRGLRVDAVEVTRIVDLDRRSDLLVANAWLGSPGRALSPEA